MENNMNNEIYMIITDGGISFVTEKPENYAYLMTTYEARIVVEELTNAVKQAEGVMVNPDGSKTTIN
jgi:hypothetical protein